MSENAVEQAIKQIRRALDDERKNPRFIETIAGGGYCFIGTVESIVPAPLAFIHRRLAAISAAILLLLLAAAFALRPSLPDLRLANLTRITRLETRILSPILTDGVRLFYQRVDSGRYSVAAVPVGGGDSFSPPMGVPSPELCDLSPDGRTFLIRNIVRSRNDNEPLYLEPSSGGAATRVGSMLVYDAAWFPDGRRILYSLAGGGVFETDSSGTPARPLFDAPGRPYWFRWSPDGARMRFTVLDRQTEVASLWEASGKGERPHQLWPAFDKPQCCGSWMPEGGVFLFQVRDGNSFQIWGRREGASLFHRTANAPVPLAVGPTEYRGPLPGRDGRKLFLRAMQPNGGLVRYDATSRQFIPLLPSIPVRTASFSRDGEWVAWSSFTDNSLWRAKAGGESPLRLTEGLQQAVLPHWSPDGKTIAFMARRFGGKWSVFSVPSNGGNAHVVCSADRDDGDPDWSPNGLQLVFGNEMQPPARAALHILTLATCADSTLPGSTGYFSPRWSPVAQSIVALHPGDARLDLFDLATRKWTPLTQLSAGYPNWSHDGRYVYFVSRANGRRAAMRVRVRDRRVEEIADLSPVESGSFFMADWFGLAPDDSPMVVRNLSTENIYSWDLH